MCKPKSQEQSMRWEGEEIPANSIGPAFGDPMPKLEERFPAEEVAKLRARQAREQNK